MGPPPNRPGPGPLRDPPGTPRGDPRNRTPQGPPDPGPPGPDPTPGSKLPHQPGPRSSLSRSMHPMNPGAVTTGSLDHGLYSPGIIFRFFLDLCKDFHLYGSYIFYLDLFSLQSSLSRGVCRRSGLDRGPKCRHFGVSGCARGGPGVRARARGVRACTLRNVFFGVILATPPN